MNVPNSLPERLYLLAYDTHRQKIRCGDLGYLLRAAALADLYLSGHLTEESGRPQVFVRRPGPDPMLDAVLGQIADSRPRPWTHWVRKSSRGMVRTVRDQLAADGWIRVEPRRRYGILRYNKVTVRDPRVVTQLTRGVSTALQGGRPSGRVDPYEAAAAALAANGELRAVLNRKDRRRHKQRINELSAVTGPAATALRKAIQQKRAAQHAS
ncbi:GOLPH3/VPS74 family protein [Actinomadura sp. HBU206391]|uniref:GOLPH3/VPS74 family protein n=1 Tax=Actinomadura sp. HBU206391 TaxID=2731692 RepID=UPI00164F1F5C|nr:GPP34 family phosphoprotein [Actinomadura sp. HBU206391]MBC6463300.1 GPP34 family phosphoprotein [Actinomadura sp. HBU206391]